jgi:hypothetical protein
LKRGGILWWTLASGGLLLFVPAAWLCTRSAAWLVLFGPLLLAWSVWLTRDYMLWYRGLGDGPTADAPQPPVERRDGVK